MRLDSFSRGGCIPAERVGKNFVKSAKDGGLLFVYIRSVSHWLIHERCCWITVDGSATSWCNRLWQ